MLVDTLAILKYTPVLLPAMTGLNLVQTNSENTKHCISKYISYNITLTSYAAALQPVISVSELRPLIMTWTAFAILAMFPKTGDFLFLLDSFAHQIFS